MTTNVRIDRAQKEPAYELGWFGQIRQTLGNALIITRREVRDSFRDWRIIAPIFILTFLFPFLAQFVAAEFQGFVESYGADLIAERTIPFLLMIVGFFPISISLVIALETFVGEKERRSLEPLLSTPLTNTELYIGKTLAAMIPPLVSSFGGMAVYLISLLLSDLAWSPPPMLVIQIVLLTTVQALVMVTGAVVVSSQTNSTRAANLLASFIVIPMALVINGESFIMFIAPDAESPYGIGALWAIIFGMFVVAVLLLRVGNSIFNREELLANTLDRLNLRGTLAKIGSHIVAVDDIGTPARGLLDWYRRAVPYSLSRIKSALGIVLFVFVIAFAGGFILSQIPEWQIPLPTQGETTQAAQDGDTSAAAADVTPDTLQDALSVTPLSGKLNFGFIFFQNSRVLLGTLLLAVFSFGIAALVIPPITFVVLGYVVGLVLAYDFDPMILVIGIVPHGIIEIPTIIFASAAALALGAVVTRPPRGATVGHAWTVMLGSTLKLVFALVIPGLVLAALIEAYITPVLLTGVLGG